jgi:hypothetical protein
LIETGSLADEIYYYIKSMKPEDLVQLYPYYQFKNSQVCQFPDLQNINALCNASGFHPVIYHGTPQTTPELKIHDPGKKKRRPEAPLQIPKN